MVKPEETLRNEDEYVNVTCWDIKIHDLNPTMSTEFSTAETTAASTATSTEVSTEETTKASTEENVIAFKAETTVSPAKKGLCLYVFTNQRLFSMSYT